MTWMRINLAPEPHLLNPAETEHAAARYVVRWSIEELALAIRKHKRAMEHEAAILKGYESALEEKLSRQNLDSVPDSPHTEPSR